MFNERSTKLQKVIKEVQPENAGELTKKYNDLVKNIENALSSPEKRDVAKEAKGQIDLMTDEIIKGGVDNRKQLLDEFSSELDSIADSFDLDVPEGKAEQEDASKVTKFEATSKEVQEYINNPGGSGEDISTLIEKFRKFEADLKSVKGMDTDREVRRLKLINFLDWNIKRWESLTEQEQPERLTSDRLKELVKKLKNQKSSIPHEAFMTELDWILSGVINLPESAIKNLPTDMKFYDDLIEIVNYGMDNIPSLDQEIKFAQVASANIVLSQIYALRAKYIFQVGQKIRFIGFEPDEIDNDDDGSNSDIGGDNLDERVVNGMIAEVDYANSRFKIEGHNEWHNFKDFVSADYLLGTSDKLDTSVADLNQQNLREAEEHGFTALRMEANAQLAMRSKDIKIFAAHLPKNAVLRKYLSFGWIKIEDGKSVTITDDCPNEQVHIVLAGLVKQFMVEPFFLQEKRLLAEDKDNPYNLPENKRVGVEISVDHKISHANGLFATIQRQIMTNDIYSATVSAEKFLTFLKQDLGKDNLTKDLHEKKEAMIGFIREIYLRQSARLRHLAQAFFGVKTEHKKILINTLVAINEFDDYVKNNSDFDKWSNSFDRLKAAPSVWEEANEYAKKETGLKRPEPAQEATITNAPSRKLGDTMPKMTRYDSKLQEYLDKYGITEADQSSWKEVVRFENPRGFAHMINDKERNNRYLTMLKRTRHFVEPTWVPGSDPLKRGQSYRESTLRTDHPEVAVMYGRDVLGNKIQEAEVELASTREEILQKERNNMEKYREKARDKITELLDENHVDDLKLSVLAKGKNLSVEQIQKYRQELKQALDNNPKLLDQMAESLVLSTVNTKVQEAVYDQFAAGHKLTTWQDHVAWEKIDDIIGKTGGVFNLSDRTVKFLANELVATVLITVASGGIASLVAAGAGVAFAANSARWAILAEKGGRVAKTTYALAEKGAATLGATAGFTVAEKTMSSAFMGQNTWESFGSDFVSNFVMFAALGGANSVWNRYFKSRLIGTVSPTGVREASQWYSKAGMVGKAGLRTSNYLGRTLMETGVFTLAGTAEEMIVGKRKSMEDIDFWREAGMNLATVLALHAGGKFVNPALNNLAYGLEVRRARLIENRNPKEFLRNTGIKSFPSEKTHTPPLESAGAVARRLYEARVIEAQRSDISKFREFIDTYGFRKNVFEGLSGEEAARRMAKLAKILEKSSNPNNPPKPDTLTELAINDAPVFEMLAERMKNLPFTPEQVGKISSKNPELLAKYSEKLPSGAQEMYRLVKQLNLELNPKSGAIEVDNVTNALCVITALKQQGFKVTNRKGEPLKAEKGNFTFELELDTNTRMRTNEFINEKGDFSVKEKTILEILRGSYRTRKVLTTLQTAAPVVGGGVAVISGAPEAKATEVRPVQTDFERGGKDYGITIKLNEEHLHSVATPESAFVAADSTSGRQGKIREVDVLDARKIFKIDASTSQRQVLRAMRKAGAPKEAIAKFKESYERIPDVLKPYIRVLPLERSGAIVPYYLINQAKINADLGSREGELFDTATELREIGVLPPRSITEASKLAGIPELTAALNPDVMKADMTLPLIIGGLGGLILYGHKLMGFYLRRRREKKREDSIVNRLTEEIKKSREHEEENVKKPEATESGKSIPSEKMKTIKPLTDEELHLLSEENRATFETAFDEIKKISEALRFSSVDAGENFVKTLGSLQYLSLKRGEVIEKMKVKDKNSTEVSSLKSQLTKLEGEYETTENSLLNQIPSITGITEHGANTLRIRSDKIIEKLFPDINKKENKRIKEALWSFIKLISQKDVLDIVRRRKTVKLELKFFKAKNKKAMEILNIKEIESIENKLKKGEKNYQKAQELIGNGEPVNDAPQKEKDKFAKAQRTVADYEKLKIDLENAKAKGRLSKNATATQRKEYMRAKHDIKTYEDLKNELANINKIDGKLKRAARGLSSAVSKLPSVPKKGVGIGIGAAALIGLGVLAYKEWPESGKSDEDNVEESLENNRNKKRLDKAKQAAKASETLPEAEPTPTQKPTTTPAEQSQNDNLEDALK